MKTVTLSKSDIKQINSELNELYGKELLHKKDLVKKIEDKFLEVNGQIMLFLKDEKFVPTLKTLLKNNFMKKITVDMGSIKFICNGADLLRPGIVEVEPDIKKGDIVSIIDERNKKPIAVMETLYDSEEIQKQEKGKSAVMLHYVGDQIWNS